MIGIVSGVGPYAGLDLAKNIFDNTIANVDQDHLPLALLSVPSIIADRTEYLLGIVKTNPALAIAKVILDLEKMGATLAGIPCNTAHASEIFSLIKSKLTVNDSKIKLINMVDETILEITANYPEVKKAGVLSTTGSYQFEVYSSPLKKHGLKPIIPSEKNQKEVVHQAIYDKDYGIKACSSPVTAQARAALLSTIEKLVDQGAELIIKGCTEIVLAVPEKHICGVPTIDPSKVLARSLIKHLDPQKLKSS